LILNRTPQLGESTLTKITGSYIVPMGK